MSGGLRRPIVVAVVGAVLAVVVFGVGLGLGSGDQTGDGGWQERLAGLGVGSELRPADLRPTGGSCDLSPTPAEAADVGDPADAEARADVPVITVETSCVLTVEPFGGRFSMAATKTGSLRAVEPVRAVLLVEGVESAEDLAAGCGVDLVFGRSGGQLALLCRGLGPCRVQLAPGDECS